MESKKGEDENPIVPNMEFRFAQRVKSQTNIASLLSSFTVNEREVCPLAFSLMMANGNLLQSRERWKKCRVFCVAKTETKECSNGKICCDVLQV